MSWRTGHGNSGKGNGPRIEVIIDELPAGLPADPVTEQPGDRGPNGAFLPGNSLAARGGRASKKENLTNRLGLGRIPPLEEFRPYKKMAAAFRRAHCASLAETAGNGFCGPAPSVMVASAAMQLAWARYFGDKGSATGDVDLILKAARLSDSAKQQLGSAWELCVREGEARRKQQDTKPHAALELALREKK